MPRSPKRAQRWIYYARNYLQCREVAPYGFHNSLANQHHMLENASRERQLWSPLRLRVFATEPVDDQPSQMCQLLRLAP